MQRKASLASDSGAMHRHWPAPVTPNAFHVRGIPMHLFSRLAMASVLLAALGLSACQSSGGDYRNATVNRVIANDGIGQADDN
jgi:hypothetical protein